jgi:hypothetical protein
MDDGAPLAIWLTGAERAEPSGDRRETLPIILELGHERVRDCRDGGADRELSGEVLDLRNEDSQRPGALELEDTERGGRRDVRVAVAVAADPRTETHRNPLAKFPTEADERGIDVLEEFRQSVDEHLAEEVEDRPRFVLRCRLGPTELVGQPDGVDEFVHSPIDPAQVCVARPDIASLFDERGDLGQLVENRTAGCLCRVSGEHRTKIQRRGRGEDLLIAVAEGLQPGHCLGKAAVLGTHGTQLVDPMYLLSCVREVEVDGEGTNEVNRIDELDVGQRVDELFGRRGIAA